MKNIKNSVALKIICYITIPIMVGIIIINCIVGIILAKEPNVLKADNIYATEEFASIYSSDLNYLSNLIAEISEDMERIVIESNNRYYDMYSEYTNENNEKMVYNIADWNIEFNYVVINKKTKTAYTNLSITSNKDTIEELIQYIKEENAPYWNAVQEKIETNIDNLKKENLSYSDRIYKWVETNSDYEIYTTLNNINGSFWEFSVLYNIIQPISETPYQVITLVLIILTIIACIYLLVSLGHKKGYDGIYLNWLDRVPLEFILTLLFFGLFFGFSLFDTISSYATMTYTIVSASAGLFMVYVTLAIAGTTIIKRLKANTIIKSTLIYKLFIWIRNLIGEFLLNTRLVIKLGILYGGFALIFFLLMIMSASYYDFGFLTFLLFVFVVFVFIKLYNYTKNLYKVKDAIKNIYEGNNEITLNPNEMKGDLKDVSIHINDIAGGFSNAIEESIKSERFKTELITNVSHDIKTPLTSIINYVDLLKQEEINNEKVKEYIQILDQKSQRLKKLTEDLVEASKASSGNVKLEMEKLNIVELIKQATGEFEDKFNKKNLKVIAEMPESEVNILADNRYVYRIIENIFSNIAKYALDDSRVYIDVLTQDKKAQITIKNISKESLNISSDELMQRFVRGEKSRTTEGSGLGLSISKSLTEIQNGTFEIQIDGDLFKAKISFDLI